MHYDQKSQLWKWCLVDQKMNLLEWFWHSNNNRYYIRQAELLSRLNDFICRTIYAEIAGF